jgi:hypothetical protein
MVFHRLYGPESTHIRKDGGEREAYPSINEENLPHPPFLLGLS